jgi:hypothetical protein
MVWFSGPETGMAQPVSEVINLQAGWNAVWFNVEPQPNDPVLLLAQQPPPLQVQAIWTFETNQDVRSSTSGTPGRWFFYDKDVPSNQRTLRTLQGHRAYLILVNVAGALHLSGEPVIRETSFSGRVSNLFGAASNPAGGSLTFEEFFSHPNARNKVRSGGLPVTHEIFAVSGQTLVRRAISDSLAPNQAYWVNVVQDFDYAGPLDVGSSANGLSFGKSTALRTLSIEIPASPSARTLSLRARPCVVLSGGSCAASAAGGEWLEYREPGSTPSPVWQPLLNGLTLNVPPGTTRIDLDVRAQRGPAALSATASAAGSGAPPPLVIDITDDQGGRAVVAADVALEPIFGRWVGRAELTQVSTHPSIQELSLEQAEATPLGMTLLLDLPDGGSPRILDSVTIQTFRDGRPLRRSFNSILVDRPVTLTEDAADPIDPLGATGTFRGTLRTLPEDPLNPYRHRYHPEHRKGYDITRQITLKLEVQPPSVADELAGLDGTLGPQRLTGTYTEIITGVTHDAITVQGTFRLERLIGEPVP